MTAELQIEFLSQALPICNVQQCGCLGMTRGLRARASRAEARPYRVNLNGNPGTLRSALMVELRPQLTRKTHARQGHVESHSSDPPCSANPIECPSQTRASLRSPTRPPGAFDTRSHDAVPGGRWPRGAPRARATRGRFAGDPRRARGSPSLKTQPRLGAAECHPLALHLHWL